MSDLKTKKRHRFLVLRFLLLGIFLVTTGYCIVEFFVLQLYVKKEQIPLTELTKEQKEEDFRYLTQFVEECYPYAFAVKSIKRLPSIVDRREEYIRRAGETADNAAFLKLFVEYAQELSQAGHYGIEWLAEDNYSASFCLMFDVRKDAFFKSSGWLELGRKLSLYVHSDLPVAYRNGAYVVTKDTVVQTTTTELLVPAGAKVTHVNGLPADEYVALLQAKQVLRYDGVHDKVYVSELFRHRLAEEDTAFQVRLLTATGTEITAELPMLNGPKPSAKTPEGNVFCTGLTADTGYIWLGSFDGQYMESDRQAIQQFMQESGSRFRKLIIDVRGNTGGEPSSYMENLIRPLLKSTVEYKERTAVLNSYFKRMNLHYYFYRFAATNHLWNREKNHITDIKRVSVDGFDEDKWRVYEVTRKLTKNNTFPFSGDVYVLCDGDTLSAGDSFVRAVKEIGIGTVVGTNTLGLGNCFMQPNLCALPNSGLVLRMDVEMPLNTDGTINSIVGTAPDVVLVQETERGYDKQSLLLDNYVQWVLRRASNPQ